MHIPYFSSTLSRFALASGTTVLLAVGAAACGGDSSPLSEVAQRGKSVAANNGCASCHGANGQGGAGPAWIDLAGSDVTLAPAEAGGATTTVIADDAYLLRSILDPDAEVVDGSTLKMPSNGLTPDQAADVVAYIKELISDPQT